MPVAPIVAAFNGIATGLALLGVGLLTLTLAMCGIAMFFSWFDTHIGGFLKRVLVAALGGSAFLGGAGAMGIWLGGLFGLH